LGVAASSNNLDLVQPEAPATGREAVLDRLLQGLFQQLLDEPAPLHLIALVGRLDAAAPLAR
jgi:hypothetical protein